MTIAKNSVVSFTYTLKNSDNNVIDTNVGSSPLSYIQGSGAIIPGLDKEMIGKSVGDSFSATILPDKGYGNYDETLLFPVPVSSFQKPDELKIGMPVQVQQKEREMILYVKSIEDKEVVLDGNHPLAGQTLNFDINIVNVREATETELEHGHVHEE